MMAVIEQVRRRNESDYLRGLLPRQSESIFVAGPDLEDVLMLHLPLSTQLHLSRQLDLHRQYSYR